MISSKGYIINIMDTFIISTRHAVNLDNTDHRNTLSRHQNMLSSISSTSTTASNPTTVPVTPMAPTPSISTADSNPAPRLPPSSHKDTCTDCTNKWVINLSKAPSPRNSYLYYKKNLTLLLPPNSTP